MFDLELSSRSSSCNGSRTIWRPEGLLALSSWFCVPSTYQQTQRWYIQHTASMSKIVIGIHGKNSKQWRATGGTHAFGCGWDSFTAICRFLCRSFN